MKCKCKCVKRHVTGDFLVESIVEFTEGSVYDCTYEENHSGDMYVVSNGKYGIEFGITKSPSPLRNRFFDHFELVK